MRRAKARFPSGCESRPAPVVCCRLLRLQAYSESRRSAFGVLESAARVRRDNGAAPQAPRVLPLNEGQPPGWPSRGSCTVGRARCRRFPAVIPLSDGPVHAVRCCRVCGLIDCGNSPNTGAQAPYAALPVGVLIRGSSITASGLRTIGGLLCRLTTISTARNVTAHCAQLWQ